MFFPWEKVMTSLDRILESRDVTLPTKVHLVKAMVFPEVMYGCESWTIKKAVQFSLVQSLSCVRLFATPWTTACQSSPSITNSWNLPKFMSIELVIPSNHLNLCRPLPLLPSILPNIRVFSNESVPSHQVVKVWSFNFSINFSNEYSGLISFRIYWFDLLVDQGTLKNLLQYHS